MESTSVGVSIILPVYNADKWLNECLQSVFNQNFVGNLELSVFNDGSTDNSAEILDTWKLKLDSKLILTAEGHVGPPQGVGYAKNRAVEQSHGEYLCFLDA